MISMSSTSVSSSTVMAFLESLGPPEEPEDADVDSVNGYVGLLLIERIMCLPALRRFRVLSTGIRGAGDGANH